MCISDLGESPLIDRVAEIVSVDRPDVIVGISDERPLEASGWEHFGRSEPSRQKEA